MSTRRLAQNTVYLTFASIAQKVIAFVYFAVLARFVGASDTGAYFLALAVVTVIMVLDDIGLTSVAIREVAKKTSDARLWCQTVVGVKLITMPLTVVIAFVIPALLGYDAETTLLIKLAVIIMLADTLSLTFYGILRGLQNLKYEAFGVFIGQSITALIGFIFIVSGVATLPLLILALASGSIWNLFLSAYFIRRHVGWGAFIPTWQLGLRPLKIAFAFFLAAVFVKVYSYVDSFILSQTIGNEAVGIYAVAYKLTYAFQFLPLAFVGALYPTLSSLVHDQERMKKTLLDAFWYMALLAVPIVFGIWSLAPEVVGAFYGDEFAEAAVTLQILIFVLIPIFLDFPIGSLLNATNQQMTKTAIGGMTMIINIVTNVLFIRMLGIPGAAVAALISFLFLFAGDWLFLEKTVKINLFELFRQVWRIFLAGVLMAVVVMLVKSHVHFSLAIPLGAIVYLSALMASGALNKTHLDAVKLFVKRRAESEYVERSTPND